MSVIHRHARTFKRGDDSERSAAVDITAESEVLVHPISIPNGTTDQFIPMQIDSGELGSLYIKSTVDMTIETNDGTTAGDTISLTAGVAVQWYTGAAETNPITEDVTPGIYVTNASGDAGELEFYAGHEDATP